MSVSMAVVPLEPSMKGRPDIVLRLPVGAVVRALTYTPKRQLVMTAGKPDYVEVPVAFIEVDPHDDELRERRFVLAPTGTVMSVPEGYTAKWCATGFSPNGEQAAHLFEIVAAA
jgi:hypothetical protein